MDKDIPQLSKVPSSVPTRLPKKVPITIITGYLGSGKSTLLQKIGQTSKKRLAIILNEFGDSSAIEKSVTIEDASKNEAVQEWLDLGNGCLCCTVKDNGVMAIEQLIEKSRDKIDYILLETTGIADPAPIARMFWLDDGLASNIYIDGVITVLDSEHIVTCLDDVGGHWHTSNNHLKEIQLGEGNLSAEEIEEEQKKLQEGLTTAHLQIALADTILVNKVDVLDKDPSTKAGKLAQITEKVRSINSTCPIYNTSFGDIDLDKILDLHAFEANSAKVQKSISMVSESSFHDHRIATVTLTFPFFESEEEFDQIEKFIQYVLWENVVNGKEIEVHRLKGILVRNIPGSPDVRVVQGVRETYDIISGGVLLDEITQNKLVFIGKNLDVEDLYHDLKQYISI
ncbi:hypothetical protein CANTEDRAFT_113285 [Yamadazyma tenuis ATCC 10573]|uniref:CobW-domain-containing protein n=1 Tax=Candida tenuis (strain ATCC 10573 / BCRC 21748 / CBS 615 / JCM 9827 / NBRC 10315 / NRRL Y-1498 / VKM Y-70) TaxID=590646 RepID=G3B1S3_CANTC|nr:uncharacterized protein CANTEDRAFT_113285 [Yamadazyma tenuis ATCC 10573]EGV65006.1 hypothetical protein CANTEDRAFT_113285 [Yamadazyma tenuis ATCC 10573]